MSDGKTTTALRRQGARFFLRSIQNVINQQNQRGLGVSRWPTMSCLAVMIGSVTDYTRIGLLFFFLIYRIRYMQAFLGLASTLGNSAVMHC